MLTVVYGGAGSGKSEYAEEILKNFSGEKYYIATMKIYSSEDEKRIKRHRKLRAGKGFITIEQSCDMDLVCQKIPAREEEKPKCALLECMSNLVANEMFKEDRIYSGEETATKIIRDLKKIIKEFQDFVIVTNNVMEDGIVYDTETMEYIKAISLVNMELAAMADEVTEVVVGIPIKVRSKNVSN
ncbi:MAG: bifunctional adenosylcobinamide kinase/adenosylcobinamide-phosphate guanylyltransferase [Agathobacter sp.]|nr:bifunctional adenosylcobinamide kinase/adenosylcobinamide-phosphate guanylyltransferase [Agathobacter sp.]